MNRKGKITAIEINEIKNALKYGYIHYRELDSFFRNNLLGSDPLMIRTYVEEITFKVVKTIEDNINPTKLPDNATRNYYYKLYQYIKRLGTIFRIIDDDDKLREVRNGREVYEHLSYLLAEGKYNMKKCITIVLIFFSLIIVFVIREKQNNIKCKINSLEEEKEYYFNSYQELKKKNIKLYKLDDNQNLVEVKSSWDIIVSLGMILSYGESKRNFFDSKKVVLSKMLGLEKNEKNILIYIPKEKEKDILSKASKYQKMNACSLMEILKN